MRSRSRTFTAQPPSSALSASIAGRRRPAKVNLTPSSSAASLASREPNTPLAPMMRTSVDIVEQDLLVEQFAGPRMLDDQLEEEGPPAHLPVQDASGARRHCPRQRDSPAADPQEIMIADEREPIAQRLQTHRH